MYKKDNINIFYFIYQKDYKICSNEVEKKRCLETKGYLKEFKRMREKNG